MKRLTFLVSIAVHALGLAVLAVYSFWHINKLEPRYAPVTFVASAPPPAPPPPPPPPPPPKGKATPKPTREVKQPQITVQPPDVVPEAPDTSPDAPDGEVGGEQGGQKGGEVGGDRDNGQLGGKLGGIPGGTGVLDPSLTKVVAPPPPVKPQVVAPAMMEGQRIAGNKHILLPDSARQVLAAQGTRRLDVAVKLCLSAAGEPTSVAFLRGTGFPAADDKIRAEVNAWRYRPYRADGQAVPVCMAINFVYLLE